MATKVKRPIKLPDVLICLGRAVSVTGAELEFKWPIKAKCQLFCSTTGASLYCLVATARPSSKSHLEKALKKQHDQVSAGMQLYERWHEFDAASGSLVHAPRGFLFNVDRAVSIVYASDKWVGRARSYIHTFKTPPKVWVNRKTDPTLLVMTGGRIKVSKEGITG
jgi:hypothetical protein